MSKDAKRDTFFEEVVKQYCNQIVNFAYRLIGNVIDAEDLAQEVLLKAYRKFSQFKTGTNLTAWLYRITVNLYKDKLRYEKRRKTSSHIPLEQIDLENQKYDKQLSVDDNLLEKVEIIEKKEMLIESLAKLNSDERTIIVLRGIERKSYTEIAKILKCPVGTAKSRMFYACESLRKEIRGLEKDLEM